MNFPKLLTIPPPSVYKSATDARCRYVSRSYMQYITEICQNNTASLSMQLCIWINVWVYCTCVCDFCLFVCVRLSVYACWWHPCSRSSPALVMYPCNGVMKIHDESMLTALASLPSSSTWIKRTRGGKKKTGKLILMPNYFWTWQPGSGLACVCMCLNVCVCVCVVHQCCWVDAQR